MISRTSQTGTVPGGAGVLGLFDEDFEQRRPLKGQITKREVRARWPCTPWACGATAWCGDIGSGSGSVAIEAGLIAREGKVLAIERDPESLPLLERNAARLGCGNVEVVAGEAPEVLHGLENPDSVFIGGSGGKLDAILEQSARRLNPGGRVVINVAVLERAQQAYRKLLEIGFSADLGHGASRTGQGHARRHGETGILEPGVRHNRTPAGLAYVNYQSQRGRRLPLRGGGWAG